MYKATWLPALLVAVGLAGCGAPSSAPATDAQAELPIVADAGAPAQPAATEQTDGAYDASAQPMLADESPASDLNRDFVATDPATVQLAAGRPQMVEFFAHWCPTCQAMKPIVHGLEERYGDRIDFVYLDIDDPATQPLKEQLAYDYQPYYALVSADGTIVSSWQGTKQEPAFAAELDQLVAD